MALALLALSLVTLTLAVRIARQMQEIGQPGWLWAVLVLFTGPVGMIGNLVAVAGTTSLVATVSNFGLQATDTIMPWWNVLASVWVPAATSHSRRLGLSAQSLPPDASRLPSGLQASA